MNEQFKLLFLYSLPKDERFIENLLNAKKFCISCGEHYCDDCRDEYGPFSEHIVGAYQLDDNFPPILENPQQYLPEQIPSANVIIAFNLHGDILTCIPEFAHTHGVEVVIIPVEIGEKVPKGLELQVSEDLESYGIEYAFPRPFCSLKKKSEHTRINEFIDFFQIGYPKMNFIVKKNTIVECTLKTTAPCGSTFYICREIVRNRTKINKKLKEIISKSHHSYPCNASMKEDTTLGDTTLHIAGYIHREAIYTAILNAVPNPTSNAKNILKLKDELETLRNINLKNLK